MTELPLRICAVVFMWPVSLNDDATGDNFPDVKLNQKECVKCKSLSAHWFPFVLLSVAEISFRKKKKKRSIKSVL